jgi:hypothetical protein
MEIGACSSPMAGLAGSSPTRGTLWRSRGSESSWASNPLQPSAVSYNERRRRPRNAYGASALSIMSSVLTARCSQGAIYVPVLATRVLTLLADLADAVDRRVKAIWLDFEAKYTKSIQGLALASVHSVLASLGVAVL